MRKILKKRYLIPLGVLVIIGLIVLLFIPNKTDRLISAIESNDIATVKSLLESGVDPNRTNVQPSILWTFLEYAPRRPLSVACGQGNLQIVQLLIDYGATAEIIEGTEWCPLRKTLFHYDPDDPQIVKLLLEHGANRTDDDGDGVLPVFAAAKMIPRVFDPQKTNGTAYFDGYDQETAEGITEIVVILLGDDSVNITNDSDQTLLMIAVQQKNIHLTKYLLDSGCNIETKDIYGKTALDYAKQTNNDTIIDLLKQAQADSPSAT